jgi:transposase InsO family protein
MKPIVCALLAFLSTLFRSRRSLQLEIVALRHQLAVYQRTAQRPRICPGDRVLWSWIARRWSGWRDVLVIVEPGTVIAWQRKRFRDHWAKLSSSRRPGRPPISDEIKALIRTMSEVNTGWGSPRIVGELRKLGIDVAKSTVEKYRVRSRKPPSPTWKSFLTNHLGGMVSIDFFVVPTVRLRVLFVLVILAHHRRRVVHFNVTEHPTAQWTGQQIIEAFPWDTAPKYLLRDRDGIYGLRFQERVAGLGIEEVVTVPRSPWQNAFVERVIGSIRRECLDHVLVMNDRHLKRILSSYFDYYHRWRTHLSLEMDSPESRSVQPPALGRVVAVPEVGGLHHHYERLAA